jgi:hypothetical protein
MLVYVQSSGPYKNGVNQGSTPYGVTTPMPTGPLAEKVTQINKEYDALWDDFEMRFVILFSEVSANTYWCLKSGKGN